jgi:hypothetical protein
VDCVQALKEICWGGANITPRPEWIKSSLTFNEAEQLNAFGLKADKVHLTYFKGRVEGRDQGVFSAHIGGGGDSLTRGEGRSEHQIEVLVTAFCNFHFRGWQEGLCRDTIEHCRL